jgi:hypothetical protein
MDLVSATELHIATANLEKDDAVKKNASLQDQVTILTQTIAAQGERPLTIKLVATPKAQPAAQPAASSKSHNSFALLTSDIAISEMEEEEEEDPLGNKCVSLDAADNCSANVIEEDDEDIAKWEQVISSKKARKSIQQKPPAASIILAAAVDRIAASTAAATPPLFPLAVAVAAAAVP